MKEAETLQTEDTSWLGEYQGVGQESLTSDVRSVPFLGLVQPDSNAISDETPAGTWRNSASGKGYGSMVRVIPLAFHTIWAEREGEAPFRTIARYAPRSIEVEIKQPKQGKRGFAKMYSAESGNEVVEQYVYAVVLPDYPEDGVLYFSPSLISMKSCRSWNSVLFSQLIPNSDKQAPIFAYSWNLCAELVQNPQQPNKEIAKLVRVARDVLTSKDIFGKAVKPQLATIKQSTLLIANSVEGDAAE